MTEPKLQHRGFFLERTSGPRQSLVNIGHSGLFAAKLDGPGSFEQALYFEKDQDTGLTYSVDFELFQINYVASNGEKHYLRRDLESGSTAELRLAEIAAYGSVEAYGCTELTIGTIHLCDRQMLEDLLRVVKMVRVACAMHMPEGSDIRGEYE
jgi:hypothetical protein